MAADNTDVQNARVRLAEQLQRVDENDLEMLGAIHVALDALQNVELQRMEDVRVRQYQTRHYTVDALLFTGINIEAMAEFAARFQPLDTGGV